MKVAKLSTDKIVQLLKPAQTVLFDSGTYVLVCNTLLERSGKIEPYWVPSTTVVWILEFKDET